jgi:adenosine kinase
LRIVVTGSLAYDYIMNFPGYFRDHIVPEKVHMLSVSFLVDSMKRMRGGVAGNIAYNLALLGERPLVVASAGQDFREYREWMEKVGVDPAGVMEVPEEFTASCFINTDKANNQIVAFYSGAMSRAKELSLEGRGLTPKDLVLISPTDPMAIERCATECKQMGIPYIFDPGKQTPRLNREQILSGANGCAVLIGNDYEFGMMAQATGETEDKLFTLAPMTVVTRGEQGSRIYLRERGTQPIEVPCAPVKEVVDPTGAGDAYLAGLAFGYARRYSPEVIGRIAALAASYAIEHRGCQEHSFKRSDFVRRYESAFGTLPPEIAALGRAA